MELLLTLLAILVALLLIGVIKIIRAEELKYCSIPGPPKSNFFLGHLLDFKRARESEKSNLQLLLAEWCKKYGLTIKVFFLHRCVVITAHPEGVKEALFGGHPKSPELYGMLFELYGSRFLGKGLVTEIDHNTWFRRRRALDPAFRGQFLKDFMEQFNEIVDAFIEALREQADGQTVFNLADYIHRMSMDVIAKVVFSTDTESLRDAKSPFPDAVYTLLEAMYRKLFKGDLGYPILGTSDIRARTAKALELLRGRGRELLENRRKMLSEGVEPPSDILNHIIKMQNADPNITTESLLDDFITFFLAGIETTANTLGFLLRAIGQRPDVAERLKQELENVVGDNGAKSTFIEYDQVRRLRYMTMVIKESMRLYPVVASTFRTTDHACDIAGYQIPAGTIVMVSNYIASRNPDVFEDALTFKPERFSRDAEQKVSVYTTFPFSVGSRSCIGQTFAKTVMKILVAKLFQNYDFKLDPNWPLEIEEVSTLRPKGGVMCTLRPRAETAT